ncbi:MAG TPA: SRPBCC domain-containing protein [Bradyrhizobium sp.]|nr:SRPBCC domain-containing protein [Bradyrhizobium sp.]
MAQAINTQVRITHHFTVSPEAVFDAWLDQATLPRWMCPAEGVSVTIADLDPKVGGRFRIVMRSGGQDIEHTGVYQEIIRPRRLVFTWISQMTEGPSLVTVDLAQTETGTDLTLTHERLPNAEAADRHRMGWASILKCLDGELKKGI